MRAARRGAGRLRVYDSWYGNPSYSRYRYPYQPFAYGLFPYSEYRWVAGDDVKTLRAVAIKYKPDDAATVLAP